MTTEELQKTDAPASGLNKLDLFGFYEYVKLKMKWLLAAVLVCTITAIIYVFFIAVPKYEGIAQIYVVNSKESSINLSDIQLGSYLTSDYQHAFQTWEVNQMVIDNLQLPYSVEEIKEMLEVKNPSNTRILEIIFTSPDAKEAAAVANEYAAVASDYISELMLTVKPMLISTALEPLQPAKPQKVLIIGGAFMLSTLFMLWCLFVAFLFDDKIKTDSDLKRTVKVEPLAVVPRTQLIESTARKEQ